MLYLKSLELQLQSLKTLAQDAAAAKKPPEDIRKICLEVEELEMLVQERKDLLTFGHAAN